MNNLEIMWGTPVLKTNVISFEKERNYILNKLHDLETIGYKNLADESNNTTVNGFHTNYDFLNDANCLQLVPDLLNKYSQQYWSEIVKNSPEVPRSVELGFLSWVVKYNVGGYQNQHLHKSSLLTGLWFLNVAEQEPGAGELHLQNPNVASFTLGFYAETLKIKPKTNDVIIIPSWLAHNVTPSTADRIVLTWDVIAVPT